MSEFKSHWTRPRSLENAAHEILTNHSLEQYRERKPQLLTCYDVVQQFEEELSVLDYGCGMGRALHWLRQAQPRWYLYGYDNSTMLDKVHQVWPELPAERVSLYSSWPQLQAELGRCELINAELVLQHMTPEHLEERLPQLADLLKCHGQFTKPQAGMLFVHTRRTLDDATTPVVPFLLKYFRVLSTHDATPEFVWAGDSQDHFSLSLTPLD